MNRNFGKLENGAITYAPDTLYIAGRLILAPRAEHFAAAGYLPVLDAPATREGFYAVPTGWAEKDGAIVRTYEERAVEPPPPPVFRYSKLKLIVAAKSAGKWAAFKSFIEANDLADEWAACQFLSSDYEQFSAAKSAIIAAGVATAEEIEAILAASVDEEVR